MCQYFMFLFHNLILILSHVFKFRICGTLNKISTIFQYNLYKETCSFIDAFETINYNQVEYVLFLN